MKIFLFPRKVVLQYVLTVALTCSSCVDETSACCVSVSCDETVHMASKFLIIVVQISEYNVNVGSVLKHYESQLSKEKATYAGLTEAQRKNVEEMLLAGDLLEVTTDETTQLWQVKCAFL